MIRMFFFRPGGLADNKRTGNQLLVAGIILVVLGAASIIAAFSATLATVFLFGVLLLFAGTVQLLQAFSDRSHGYVWRLLVGALYSLVGLLVVVDPLGGAVSLTLWIVWLFIGGGILRLILFYSARQMRLPVNGQLTTGVLNLILAALILAGWPETGTWVIGLFLGIEFLFAGFILVLARIAVGQKPSE